MFILLLSITALTIILAIILAYWGTRDVFHPVIIIGPILFALYVYWPVRLLQQDAFGSYLSEENLIHVQLINFLGVLCFCVGALRSVFLPGTGQKLFCIPAYARQKLIASAAILGCIGLVSYMVTIANRGGFAAAYGSAYGGGISDYGYVRDSVFFTIPAVVLLLAANVGRPLTLQHKLAAVLLLFPLGIQAILGARRGPIFLIIASLVIGWFMVRYKRPRLLTLATGGILIGLLMLFVVTNRSSLHLGSDWNLKSDLTEYMNSGTGNEYLYGAATVVHAEMTDQYYWGRRYLTILFVRPIPVQLWPNKYEDMGMGTLMRNNGLAVDEFRWTLGWAGAPGAASGLVADMWAEFWWFSLAAILLCGWAYGHVWWLAVRRGGFAVVLYTLMASVTVFLVMQTLEAALVRILWLSIPSYMLWRWSLIRPRLAADSAVGVNQT